MSKKIKAVAASTETAAKNDDRADDDNLQRPQLDVPVLGDIRLEVQGTGRLSCGGRSSPVSFRLKTAFGSTVPTVEIWGDKSSVEDVYLVADLVGGIVLEAYGRDAWIAAPVWDATAGIIRGTSYDLLDVIGRRLGFVQI